MDNKIGWGVDGCGCRHFVCNECGARLGWSRTAQVFEVKHKCGDGVWKEKEEASVMSLDELMESILD